MEVIVINPPLVQLNTPYPSGAYLSAFFKKVLSSGGEVPGGEENPIFSGGTDPSGFEGEASDSAGQSGAGGTDPSGPACDFSGAEGSSLVRWYDLSIRLFYSIFSRDGLTKLFDLSERHALELAEQAEASGDEPTAFNLRRYISTKNSWINWIDFITQALRGGGQERAHQFLYSPGAPRGNRMEAYLSDVSQLRQPTVDDIRFLCTYALADLADYITAVFDPNFSLIRYAEALTVNESSFAEIEKQIASPVMEYFYKPVLEQFPGGESFPLSAAVPASATPSSGRTSPATPSVPLLVCISVPFAGTFTPALYTAKYLKEKYGSLVYVVIGGGFVNTELREITDKALAKYVDALSYDRGYGSYKALLELLKNPSALQTSQEPLYKLCRFLKNEEGQCTKIIEPLWQQKELQLFEDSYTAAIIPDYSDIDFSIYPRTVDDLNPMHRLWVDGAWVKAYLAHGCYWHKCAFCDTQLDYVCAYKQTDIEPLFQGLLKTCRQKNVYGIHFVDEALPPSALKKFALLNAQNGNQLYYWGNIRFEKNFNYDLAAFLSYCGFGGASAGIEAATNNGLQTINKGTDIHNIVSDCCAFKENGILVHAYMIYGFWNDTPQFIIDSMETLRQLFAEGLLDSAFWHKFVLTKNSTVFAQWQKGLNPELKPVLKNQDSMFAKNDLHFEGENKYTKFGPALDSAVNSWMKGEKLDVKINKWFNFQVPETTVPKNYIQKEIEKYEHAKEARADQLKFGEGLYWLGSAPVVSGNKITWFYLQEEMAMEAENSSVAKELSLLLAKLKPEVVEDRKAALEKISTSRPLQKKIRQLYASGIIEL